MQTLSHIRELLVQHGLQPKHRLGQNFLHDKNQLKKLLDAAAVQAGDRVLEVGPGTGTLTSALLSQGAEVVACELDEGLARVIESVCAGELASGRLQLIHGDILPKSRGLHPKVVDVLAGRSFKLVANLPYQVATPLMTTLLIDHRHCIGQFVTIQSEVAERLMAKPSSKAYGPLSIITQSLASVERLATLSPSCFWPEPDVTSAMVAIRPGPDLTSNFPNVEDARDFARFVTQLFTKRRKQLGSVFGRGRLNWPAGVQPEQRPESLTTVQAVALWRAMRNSSEMT